MSRINPKKNFGKQYISSLIDFSLSCQLTWTDHVKPKTLQINNPFVT